MTTDIAELIGNGMLSIKWDGRPLTAEQLAGRTFNYLIGCEIMFSGKPLVMYYNEPPSRSSMPERRFYWGGYYSLSGQLPDFAGVILESACIQAMERLKEYGQ